MLQNAKCTREITFNRWRWEFSEKPHGHFQDVGFLQLWVAGSLKIREKGRKKTLGGRSHKEINQTLFYITNFQLTSLPTKGTIRSFNLLRLSLMRARLLFSIRGLRVCNKREKENINSWKKENRNANTDNVEINFEKKKNQSLHLSELVCLFPLSHSHPGAEWACGVSDDVGSHVSLRVRACMRACWKQRWFVIVKARVLTYIEAWGVWRSVQNLLWLGVEEEEEDGDEEGGMGWSWRLRALFHISHLLTAGLSFNLNWWHAPQSPECMSLNNLVYTI